MTNEEAIAIIRNEYKCVDRDCDIERSCGKCDLMMPNKEPILEAYKLAIKALEQQPTTTTNNNEPITVIYPTIVCDAAISRDAVKKWVCKTCPDDAECQRDCDVIKGIDALPPVTPQQKYGKWIRVTDKTGHLVWECDKCSWQQRFNTNFCPECGAKMVEGSEKK